MTDLKEQLKWLDYGAGNPGNSFATVTAVQLTSNVATYTSQNNFAVGQTVEVSGTATGSGLFNISGIVTANNFNSTLGYSTTFSMALTNANVNLTSDSGYASGVWNWGIVAPTVAPTLVVTESGAAAVQWQASTYFSTMGIIIDSNSNGEQLISVNANGTNVGGVFGTSSSGQPTWNQTIGQTTSDNTITWTNKGPVVTWAANTTFTNAGNISTGQCAIYDPTSGAIFVNIAPGFASGTTSTTKPHFTNIFGSIYFDGTVKWYCIGTASAWAPSTVYGVFETTAGSAIIEPAVLPAANNQITYLQASGSGTSSASFTAPNWATTFGQQTTDNQLNWINLGSTTWSAGRSVIGWTVNSPNSFSVIADGTNLEVCVQSGVTATIVPGTSDALSAAGNASAGNTTYTGTFATAFPAGYPVVISGFVTHTANNGTFTVVSCNTTTLVVNNSGGIAESHAATAVWNPWSTVYGGQTNDGSAIWVNVGASGHAAWAASEIFYLPSSGFNPPSPTDPYGGAEVLDSNGNVEFAISSGKSGSSPPSWNAAKGGTTTDNSQITWYNNGPAAAHSLSWTSGYSYVYAFKARNSTDPDVLTTPPLGTSPLGFPTGSADGSVSTASPVASLTPGGNAGAVITVSGVGSTDPQVDTISIFRTDDGGTTYYFLTDVANPPMVGGHAGTWVLQDYMTDNPTSTLVGLNTLIIAPIADSNNPPPAASVAPVQHLGRIFLAVGSTIYCSEGPLVGGSSQPPGNGYTAFNPAQFWVLPSPVTRMISTSIGLIAFTTSDVYSIQGGPLVTSLYQNIYLSGIGLTSYNALAVQGTTIYLVTADNQCVSLDPNMGGSEIGKPVGDQINAISPASAYVTFHVEGTNDKALFVANGSTGWLRCNPNLAPDSSISGPVWSPFATIVGGVKAIASLEVIPGKHALLLGATAANQPILVRDSTFTTFSDNGNAYGANMTFGSMVLVQPGQIAELGFITCEFILTGTSPLLSVLLDEISGTFESLSGYTFATTGLPPQDPPTIYGTQHAPASLYANRYYFAQQVSGGAPTQGVECRHMQVKVDFGNTDTVQNELLTMTVFGRHWQEM